MTRTRAIREQTRAINALRAEIAKQNALLEQTTDRHVAHTLADVVNGELGYRVKRRLDPPSFGSVHRC
jgi:phosphoglycerate dehydrogenase-like enzyme